MAGQIIIRCILGRRIITGKGSSNYEQKYEKDNFDRWTYSIEVLHINNMEAAKKLFVTSDAYCIHECL